MTKKIKTRFAPSPTGFLHIGGARTALFNYLFARQNGGEFVLRVEDTDVERSTEESVTAILDGMEWLGLEHDPASAESDILFQSKRFDIYRKHAEDLLDRGLAYKCYCTQEELQSRREEAMAKGTKPMYDKRCRTRADSADSNEMPFTIRFKIEPGVTGFKDLIKGNIEINNEEIEDFIILRSDKTPTYHLVVVVDDAEMGISHVIRGDDHINNTPKQIPLYKALNFEIPEFAHLPMIMGADKARLSKRHGATSVIAYKEMGYLPEALLNYLARLGWSHGDDEIFTMDELIEKFSLDNVGKSAGIFNPDKLLWLNTHYIKNGDTERLANLTLPFFEELGVDNADADPGLQDKIETLKERAKTLRELAESGLFYYTDIAEYDEKAANKHLTPEIQPVLLELIDTLARIEDFTAEAIGAAFKDIIAKFDMKLGKLAQPVRVALTGSAVSPGIFETIHALGKDKTLDRITDACLYIDKSNH